MDSPGVDESAIQQDVVAHTQRNAALIENINSRGGDAQRERSIDCFFHTRTEDDAISLSRLLQSRGLHEISILQSSDEDQHPWTVQGSIMSSVSDFVDPSRVEHFVRLAAEHGALYDGWGTLLDELPPTI
ncbi:MAG: ribonuclease E inhibitor RraB [Verrucomicrobiota bacterium]